MFKESDIEVIAQMLSATPTSDKKSSLGRSFICLHARG